MQQEMNFVDAFHSWVDKGNITDAPKLFLEMTALQILSCAVNRNIFVTWGRKKLYPSIWLILIGRSGVSRKSTCLDLCSKFVYRLDEGFVLPNEWSSEAFVQTLADNNMGIMVVDEFITLLDTFKKEYARQVKNLITELYDREIPWTRRTLGGGIITINDPFLTIFGCTTPAWLQDAISESDIKGGFIPRFLLVYANKKSKNIAYPGWGDEEEMERMVTMLEQINKTEYQLKLSDKADEMFREFSTEINQVINQTANDVMASFLSRLVPYTLKFAILYHASNLADIASEEVTAEEMEKSINLIKLLHKSEGRILSTLAFSGYAVKRQKVLDYLKKKGKEGCMYSELLQHMQISSSDLKGVVGSLVDEESIKSTMQDPVERTKNSGRSYKRGQWLRIGKQKKNGNLDLE